MSDQEIKIGQSVQYEIAGRTLHLIPLSLGKMKRSTLIFAEKNDDNLETLTKYIFAILDNGKNGDLTHDWVQENVTMPEAQMLVTASRKINGLADFFPKGPVAGEVKVERPLEETTSPTPSV